MKVKQFRIPGKYHFDPLKGELTVKAHNELCLQLYKELVINRRKAGMTIDENEMKLIVETKKSGYRGGCHFEKFRSAITNLSAKMDLCFYRIGINISSSTFRGYGKMWGDRDRPIDASHPNNKYHTPEELKVNEVIYHK